MARDTGQGGGFREAWRRLISREWTDRCKSRRSEGGHHRFNPNDGLCLLCGKVDKSPGDEKHPTRPD